MKLQQQQPSSSKHKKATNPLCNALLNTLRGTFLKKLEGKYGWTQNHKEERAHYHVASAKVLATQEGNVTKKAIMAIKNGHQRLCTSYLSLPHYKHFAK